MAKPKLLFICFANKHRSKTAEDLFKDSEKYEVQSAGFDVSMSRGQAISQQLVSWSDEIFVMESRQLTSLVNCFNILNKKIHILGIPDVFYRGDKNLIEVLRSRLLALGIAP